MLSVTLTSDIIKGVIRKLILSVLLLLPVGSVPGHSQSMDFIEGKVINKTSFRPVPFATIKLKNNQLGVYANADGDFKLSLNPEFQSDSLIVTCIGYKRLSIAFRNLKDDAVNKIYLVPAIYGLAEVTVVASRKKLSPIVIIRRAIRSIKYNYPDKPFSYISYYRDYQKKDSNYINLNEAIIQTLDNSFSNPSRSNKYRMLDYRENTEFPRMNISPYYDPFGSSRVNNPNKYIPEASLGDQFGNELFILMVHDAIRNYNTRSFSFIEKFSTDFIYNHTFEEPVKVFDNNLLLYKINFKAKPKVEGDSLFASGAIYIQPDDYSIHKLEYSCFYKTRSEQSKKMFNIDVEYGYENSVNSVMCLKYISFNNIFKVLNRDDISNFRLLDSYLDTIHGLEPSIILRFNNKIDPVSAIRKSNYEVTAGRKPVKINGIQVVGNTLYIRLKAYDSKDSRDSCKVDIKTITDINGQRLGQRKSLELYQYRELFVQEYNKPLPLTDSCYMDYLPLGKNCISKYRGNEKYWMNTPENIKGIK